MVGKEGQFHKWREFDSLLHVLRYLFLLSAIGIVFFPDSGSAYAISFRDVPDDHPDAEAIYALVEKGVLQGYPDGTFRPADPVTRAAAAKIIVYAVYDESYILNFQAGAPVYSDIPQSEWYAASVEVLRQTGAIGGPPQVKKFQPLRTVGKAEFYKMLFMTKRINIHQFAKEGKKLAEDVVPEDWHYPFMTAAFARGMLLPSDALYPGSELTRADVARIVHLYNVYVTGGRTQYLQDRTDAAIHAFFDVYDKKQPGLAAIPSFRTILLTQGLVDFADNPEHRALQKVSWAMGKLLKNNVKESRALLKEARDLSPEVYERYAKMFK